MSRRRPFPILAVAAALAFGCSPRPQPVASPARPPTAAEAPAAESETKRPPTLVVIDPGGGEEAPSLAEAARAERERRKRSTQPPLAVITDKNLAEYAEKGKLTIAKPEPAAAADDAGQAGSEEESAGGVRDEAYWRDRALDARVRWRQAVDEVKALETEAADLRWQFYAEDDPYVRDQQVKPRWDRALDDLRRARQDERAFQSDLTALMEEGRRAGALPGWLREGIELEPEAPPAADRREPEPHGSIEPPIIGEEPP